MILKLIKRFVFWLNFRHPVCHSFDPVTPAEIDLVKKFKAAFNNTKFKSPPGGTPWVIGDPQDLAALEELAKDEDCPG